MQCNDTPKRTSPAASVHTSETPQRHRRNNHCSIVLAQVNGASTVPPWQTKEETASGPIPDNGYPDTGDTAWMLASSALVLLMTPGLAFFYGGMVRAKGVLNMMMMSISAMGVVDVLWVLYGYSMAFGNDKCRPVRQPDAVLRTQGPDRWKRRRRRAADPSTGVARPAVDIPLAGTIPQLVFVVFQLMFAIITVALISGAVADRLKFGGWLVFAGLWATFVYFPVAHWVFSFDGSPADARRLDREQTQGDRLRRWHRGPHQLGCGGLGAVHRARQAQGLADDADAAAQPAVRDARCGSAVVRLVRVQRRFGAVSANGTAAATFITTTVATAAAMLAWLLVERIRDGHATSLGAASGIVAGLVAITPSCSSVNVLGALGDRRRSAARSVLWRSV